MPYLPPPLKKPGEFDRSEGRIDACNMSNNGWSRYAIQNAVTAASVSSVSGANRFSAVPANLKCSRCRKMKAKNAFSIKQLTDVEAVLRVHPKANVQAICIDCNAPHNRLELQCVQCKKHKEKSAFSKVQRKIPEDARCLSCVDARVALVPRNEDDSSDGDDGPVPEPEFDKEGWLKTGTARSGAGSVAGSVKPVHASRLTKQLDNMSISNASTGADETEISYTTQSYRTGREENKQFGLALSKAADVKVRTGVHTSGPGTGFDVKGYGTPHNRSAATPPTHAPAHASSHLAAFVGPVQVNKKFAKVKAYVPPKRADYDYKTDSDNSDDDEDINHEGMNDL